MPKRLDLTGMTFDHLQVIGKSDIRKHRRVTWECRCICGESVVATQNELQQGHTASCGCKRRRPGKETHIADWWGQLWRNAKARKKECSISMEEAAETAQRNCFYCGTPPPPYTARIARECNNAKRRGYTADVEYLSMGLPNLHGLDRVDNTLGYVSGNIVSCCRKCNAMKSALELGEWLTQMKQIIQHMEDKEDKCTKP
jgi:hypothetical protein